MVVLYVWKAGEGSRLQFSARCRGHVEQRRRSRGEGCQVALDIPQQLAKWATEI